MRTTRTLVSTAVSVAAVASLAGTAGARIPDGKVVDSTQPQPTLSFSGFNLGMDLPGNAGLSSIDSWISDQMTRRVTALEAKFAGPDAVARAIARRNR
jgi:hypothetical protein